MFYLLSQSRSFRFRRLLAGLTLLLSATLSFADKPHRVVSLNLCLDQLLIMLAEPEHIASLSYLAADPKLSFTHEQARHYPNNRGQAEEILPLKPDLILAAPYSARSSVTLLQRLDYRVEEFGLAGKLEDIRDQIRQLATALQEQDKGEALISQMEDRIQQALMRNPFPDHAPLAVFYSSNGYSYGRHTLQDELLTLLGLRNLAAEAGLNGPGLLSLETLIRAQPDILIVDTQADKQGQLAHFMLHHPALEKAITGPQTIKLSDKYFQCAGPMFAEALDKMSLALERLKEQTAGLEKEGGSHD